MSYSKNPKDWSLKQRLINKIANELSYCGPLQDKAGSDTTYIFGFDVLKARAIIEAAFENYEYNHPRKKERAELKEMLYNQRKKTIFEP